MKKYNALWWLSFLLWGTVAWVPTAQAQRDVPLAARSESEKPEKPEKPKQEKGLWQRMKEGIGDMVPEPIKKAWRKTKKKWNQTVAVYRAMRDLFLGDEETRRKAAKVSARKAVAARWQRADRNAEKRALRELRLELWRKACRIGSSRSCQRWAKREPKLNEPLLLLRDILRRRKQWKPLLTVCRVLHKRQPTVLENQLCIADAMQAMSQRKQALALYRKLSQEFPDSGSVWLDWGRLLLREKSLEQAHKACLHATERMPRDPVAWRCLGDALVKSQRKQARAAYEKACSLGDSKACHGVLKVLPKTRLRRWWAWSRIRSKLVGRAVAGGTVYGSCKVGMGFACRKLARGYLQKAQKLQRYQRYSEALWWLRRATQFAPKQAKPWRQLGLLLMKHRHSPEACDALHRSLQINSRQIDLWLTLGACYQRAARHGLNQAREAYLRACQPKIPGVSKPDACRKACALGVKDACYHHLSER